MIEQKGYVLDTEEYILRYKEFNFSAGQNDEEYLMAIEDIDKEEPGLDISEKSDYGKLYSPKERCKLTRR